LPACGPGIGAGVAVPLRLALSVVELITHVGVAVGGIVSQAPVQWERLIGLHDAQARVWHGGWAVRSHSPCLPHQRRSRQKGAGALFLPAPHIATLAASKGRGASPE
jgi:hypothetical protein